MSCKQSQPYMKHVYTLQQYVWHVNLKSTARVTCLYFAQRAHSLSSISQTWGDEPAKQEMPFKSFQYLSINRMICGRIHLCTMLPTELGPSWHPESLSDVTRPLGFQGRTWAIWCVTSFDLTRSKTWLQLQEIYGTTRKYIIHEIHVACEDGATGRGFQTFFRFLVEGTFCSSQWLRAAPWILPLNLFAKFFHVLSVSLKQMSYTVWKQYVAAV